MRAVRISLSLLACLALTLAIGAIGGLVTRPAIPGWYAGLVKPGWTPPNAAFPIVWTTLYALMAVSLWQLWRRTPLSPRRAWAIRLFFGQLALNAAWSPLFFALHWLQTALAVIAALVVVLVSFIATALPVHRTAALLQLPYLAWICYASTLNAGVIFLNP